MSLRGRRPAHRIDGRSSIRAQASGKHVIKISRITSTVPLLVEFPLSRTATPVRLCFKTAGAAHSPLAGISVSWPLACRCCWMESIVADE